jgi:urease accessory protein UreE
MMFTVYTRREMYRALGAAEEGDELVIAFPGGLRDGDQLVGTGAQRITVRHIPEPPS